jgi:multidrug efflux system membrane fusion protein
MDDQLDVRPAPNRTEPDRTEPGRSIPDNISPRRRWVTPVIVLLVIGIVGVVGWRVLLRPTPGGGRPAAAAPQPVGVATIGTGDITVTLSGLGAVTPLATVTVQTQINGQLQEIAFTEGQMVHKGDFLAQIDPRPYQVALEQAQGTSARDTALLNQAKADYARYQTLNRQDSISHQQVEDQLFLIKQYEGAVITDQAAIDSAKLNLVYCHITSPVDGRIGIRLVDPGNYVQASNTNGLFVITQLQPISVLFTLPEDDVDEVQKQMAAGTLAVTAYDRSDAKLIATGTLATTDNQVDPTTGTVKLRAMFPNTDNALFPQQFVNAHLLLRTLKGVIVAPQAALQTGAPGQFVYLVKPDNTVAVQVVKTGAAQGGMVQILDGLKAGDRVVTDGLDRLRDGARVTVVTPAGQAAPAGGAAPQQRPRGGANGSGPASGAAVGSGAPYEAGRSGRPAAPPAAAPAGTPGATSGGGT